MEKVKYDIAIKTYMEVFDFLLNNNLFIYSAEQDFLKARIRIGKCGFVEETQISRGVWNQEYLNEKYVPAIHVLYVLTKNIDNILMQENILPYSRCDYAYLNDRKDKMLAPSKREYYRSYQELLTLLKSIKNAQDTLLYSDSKIVDFNLIKLKQLRQRFLKLTPLEIRQIECYARLEEELIKYTS